MKIQYVCVRVSTESEWINSEMVREQEFFRADKEEEVESWLNLAFTAAGVVNAKLYELRVAENKYPKVTAESIEILRREYKTMSDLYIETFGSFVDNNDEYRIVKVYKAE